MKTMTQMEMAKKVQWIINFYDNQANILSTKYKDEKLANIQAMTRDLIKAIWYMNIEDFERMYNEGL